MELKELFDTFKKDRKRIPKTIKIENKTLIMEIK